MKRALSILAAGGLLLSPMAPLWAQESATVYRPAGSWTADFGDDYCRLSRNFSSGGEQLALAFERIRPKLRLSIASKGGTRPKAAASAAAPPASASPSPAEPA